MSIHSKQELIKEYKRQHPFQGHNLVLLVEHCKGNVDREMIFIELVKEIISSNLQRDCLMLMRDFTWKSLDYVRNHLIHIDIYTPPVTIARNQYHIQTMVDIGFNPFAYPNEARLFIDIMSHWTPQKHHQIPMWIQKSIRTALHCIRPLPSPIRIAIVHMSIVGTLTLMFNGHMTRNRSLKKRIKLANAETERQCMTIVPAFNLDTQLEWKQRLQIAWVQCDVPAIAEAIRRPDIQDWHSLRLDVAAMTKLVDLFDGETISPSIFLTAFCHTEVVDYAWLLLRVSVKQQQWLQLQLLFTRPNFTNRFREVAQAIVQAGIFWHLNCHPDWIRWSNAWNHWTIHLHHDPMLYTQRFRDQADTVLETTWLPTKAQHIICSYLARYYYKVNTYVFGGRESRKSMLMGVSPHPKLRCQLPDPKKDSVEVVRRVCRRIFAENAVFYT